MPKSANRCDEVIRKKRCRKSASSKLEKAKRKLKKAKCKKKCCRRKHTAVCAFTRFCEMVYRNVKTTDQFKPLPKQNISNKSVYSYAVINRGEYPAVFRLETGPNGFDYTIDMEGVVEKGVTEVLAPSKFMRYARLSVKSKQQGHPTKLLVYFQAQLTG